MTVAEIASVDAAADLFLALREQLAEAEPALVLRMREHGYSWAAVAEVLGVSRQAAWKKYRDVAGHAPSEES